jgi:hypothetical protein
VTSCKSDRHNCDESEHHPSVVKSSREGTSRRVSTALTGSTLVLQREPKKFPIMCAPMFLCHLSRVEHSSMRGHCSTNIVLNQRVFKLLSTDCMETSRKVLRCRRTGLDTYHSAPHSDVSRNDLVSRRAIGDSRWPEHVNRSGRGSAFAQNDPSGGKNAPCIHHTT